MTSSCVRRFLIAVLALGIVALAPIRAGAEGRLGVCSSQSKNRFG